MTKNETRDMAFKARCIASGMTYNGSKSEAIAKYLLYECSTHLETTRQQPTIAQTILDAAINWPQYLGDVECQVIDAFCYPYQTPYWQSDLRRYETNQARTFMLFVAEALE